MASVDKADELSQSKTWECGDPYKYPIPANGDHWENLLTPLMESDKAQCETWKDEVQNLLIFAGLFSGILTAFVIQSYQGLQQDPNDIMIALLTRIATRLDNPLNGTASALQSVDTLPINSPATSAIRINIFWFISLVLSLTTVLIGIVSLQWLREYQQYPQSLPSKQRFALFNMRVEGLEAWYVPQIFAALPVLLQFALVLFFVGLIDFLLASGSRVAIPVIITIGVPFIFIAWTTVTPSFQAFMMCLPLGKHANRVPQQCPYKSPQSRIIRHIVTFSEPAFMVYSRSAVALHSLATLLPLRLIRSFRKNASNSEQQEGPADQDEDERSYFCGVVCQIWREKKWLVFDEIWLMLRDGYARSISEGACWMTLDAVGTSDQAGPLYDLTRGIPSLTEVMNVESTIPLSGYHCVQDLTSAVLVKNPSSLDIGERRALNHYLQKLLGHSVLNQPFGTFSAFVEVPSLALLQDENAFIFLSSVHNPPLILLQHFVELHIRVLGYMYPKIPHTTISKPLIIYPEYPNRQWVYTYPTRPWVDEQYGPAFNTNVSAQFSRVLESFFKSAADPDIEDRTFLESFPTRYLGQILRYAAIRQSGDAIQPTLKFLTTILDHYTSRNGEFGPRSDFIFYASAFYARSTAISAPWLPGLEFAAERYDYNPVVVAFLPTLRNYLQERGTPDISLGERLGVPILSDKWWEFLNRSWEEDQNSSREEPGIIVPTSPIIGPSSTNLNNPLTSSTEAPAGKTLKTGPLEDRVQGMSPNAGDLV